MSDPTQKWIIKNKQGQIKGPYTTAEVLKLISRGDFSGDEYISAFPGTDWYPISQDPNFYDKLLEILENQGESDEPLEVFEETSSIDKKVIESDLTDEIDADDFVEKTVTTPPQVTKEPPRRGRVERVGGSDKEKPKKEKDRKKKKPKRGKASSSGEVIELKKSKKVLKRKKRSSSTFAFLVILIVLTAGALFLFEPSGTNDAIKLLVPGPAQERLSQKEMTTLLGRAESAYVKDDFSNYMLAQNELIKVLEGSLDSAKPASILCLVDLELWPYTVMGSEEIKVFAKLSQLSTKSGPATNEAQTCRAVDLIIRGRFREATSVVDNIIDSAGAGGNVPVTFYYLKAKLLENANNFQGAISYLNTAQQLWPQWLRLFNFEAQLHQRLGAFQSAAARYTQVLKANPSHAQARIQLGLIEYNNLNNYEKGKTFLVQALQSGQRAPRIDMSQGYFGLAQISLKESDNSNALKYAKKAYDFNSNNRAALNLIRQLGGKVTENPNSKAKQLIFEGDQLVREGDCNAAQAMYKAAYKANPKDGLAAMKAAECLWKLSLANEAISWLNNAIKADEKLIDAYVLLADYYTQRFNFKDASVILRKAMAVSPKSYKAARGTALFWLRSRNYKNAEQFAQRAIGIYESDVESYVILAEALLGQAKFDKKKYNEAFSAAYKATEIDVNFQRGHIVYAKAISGVRGVDAGVDYILKLVNSYPLITEYRMALGEILLEDQRYDDAINVFNQVIGIEEKPKRAYIKIGLAYKAISQFETSLDALLKAAALDPSDAEALYEAGLLYLDIKKPAKARVQFQRVLRINPDYPLVNFYIGQAALMMSQPKVALKQAEIERQKNPGLAEPYLLAGEAYSRLNQWLLCAGQYNEALKYSAQGAATYVKMARCYRNAGNIDVAKQMLNNAETIESGNPEVYKEYGALYQMTGEAILAIEAYNQYLVLVPNAPDKPEIERHIRNLSQ